MKSKIVFFTLIIIFISCNHKKTEKDSLVILDSIQKEHLKITFITDTLINNEQKWIPTFNQLKIIDSIIAKAILENDNNHYKILCPDSISSYYRQFICSVNLKGDSLVYINAIYRIEEFPEKDEKGEFVYKRSDWQNRIISPCDGGEYNWQIKINFSKKKYEFFNVNGKA